MRYGEPHSAGPKGSGSEWHHTGTGSPVKQGARPSGIRQKKILADIFVDRHGPLLVDFNENSMTGMNKTRDHNSKNETNGFRRTLCR